MLALRCFSPELSGGGAGSGGAGGGAEEGRKCQNCSKTNFLSRPRARSRAEKGGEGDEFKLLPNVMDNFVSPTS